MKKRNPSAAVLLLVLAACAPTPVNDTRASHEDSTVDAGQAEMVWPAQTGSMIADVNTDQARYAPGATVTIFVDLANQTGSDLSEGTLTAVVTHLGTNVGPALEQPLSVSSGAQASFSFTWTSPTTDFQGYLIQVFVNAPNGETLDAMAAAIDVSSDWRRYPRYGYLSGYGPQSQSASAHLIWQLKGYGIDLLQFYDWQWKHHVPLAGTVVAPASSWSDIANRVTEGQTVLDDLTAAHGYNMLGMNYNLAYGAWAGYGSDGSGVSWTWGLWQDPNASEQLSVGPFPSSWATTNIYEFNPGDPDWQNYLIQQEQKVFAVYPFDGWQMDSLGDPGPCYTASGALADVPDGFASIVDQAKAGLPGQGIIFNDVGNYALPQISASSSDVMYAEQWPSAGQTTYQDLANTVAQSEVSGKATIIAAYMNYAYAQNNSGGGFFNPAGVLLTDATLFANGAAHIELGDGAQMLDNEYFPNENLAIPASLVGPLHAYYAFLIAYENLLRDPPSPPEVQCSTPGFPSTGSATAGALWTFGMQRGGQNVVHFINLLDQPSADWRDDTESQVVPTTRSDILVQCHYSGAAPSSLAWASPDVAEGALTPLTFTLSTDSQGSLFSFTLPSLEYWDLLAVGS